MRDDADSRAAQRDLVRRGYDAVSRAYRTDEGESAVGSSETTAAYESWIQELASHLAPGARVYLAWARDAAHVFDAETGRRRDDVAADSPISR